MKTSGIKVGGVVSFCLLAAEAWVLAQSVPTVREQTIPVVNFEPKGLGGTYWSWQRGEKYPPLPYNPFPELPVQTLDEKNRIFLIDDRTVDYVALQAYMEKVMAYRRLEPVYGAETAEALVLSGLDLGGLLRTLEGDSFAPLLYPAGSLWLSIDSVTNGSAPTGIANLTLHGTEPGRSYWLLSKPALTNVTWDYEQILTGAVGQDWTPTTASVGDRTNELFFWARTWSTNDEGTNLTVAITSPTAGAYYAVTPTNISLTATAEPAGELLGVGFYSGDTLVGWDSSSPYSVTWSNVGRGSYSLKARAFGKSGSSRVSGSVGFSVGCADRLDVAMVVDRSHSMSQPLQKFHDARQACSNFVSQAMTFPGDQGCIVSFDQNTTTNQTLTNSEAVLLTAITNISIPGSGTVMTSALQTATAELTGPRHTNALPVIIFLSDGAPTDPESAVLAVAEDAKTNHHIRIFTIGLGTNVNMNLMQSMATSPGDFFYTTNSADLSGLFMAVASALCRSNAAPTVQVTAPTDGTSFMEGELITLQATATDLDSGIAQVVFYYGGYGLGAGAAGASNSYSFAWSSAPAGTNSVTAVVWDSGGLSRTSGPVSITVIHPAPTVGFENPTNGQTFVFSPTNILLQASASASIGVVTNVQFRAGTKDLGSVTSEPFQALWTNVVAGSNYALRVIATDSYGSKATNEVSVVVNAMPLVSMLFPTNVLTFNEGTNLTLRAWATDSDGGITNVQFLTSTGVIGGLVATNYGTNFSLTWSNLAPGTHLVTAVAKDDRGARQSSELVVFRVEPTNPIPWARITFPTNGMGLQAGANVTITAEAGDTNGTVTNVEFFIDGKLFGQDPTIPYSIEKCCWEPGEHVLVALATDNAGQRGASVPVTVTVAAAAPKAGEGHWDPLFGKPGIQFSTGYGIEVHNGNVYLGKGSGGLLGGENINSVGKWDGTNWLDMSGSDFAVWVFDLALLETNVYAAGMSASGDDRTVARFDGADWVRVGTNFLYDEFSEPATVHSVAVVGSLLYAGGEFVSGSDNTNLQYIARLNPFTSAWEPIGNGLNGPVYALASIGNRLFAGGAFTNAGGCSNATFIAELVDGVWTNLGSGLMGTNSSGERAGVYALAVCDNDLFVGGDFTTAGGDTNANGIAKWDGRQWSTIGRGLAAADDNGPMRVRSITPNGKGMLYVAGDFASVWQDESQLPARHIARAVWSDSSQAWVWSDLDQGLTLGGGLDYVCSTTLMSGATPECHDLLVSGYFRSAGSAEIDSSGIARWRVGYPRPPGPPSVTITNPANYAVFTNESISLNVEGRAVSGSNITVVSVYVNGAYLGGNGDYTTNFDFSVPVELTNGVYTVKAVATDENGLKGESAATVVSVKKPNNSIFAADDVYTIGEGTPAVALPVVANDSPSNGVKRVTQVLQAQKHLGTVAVGHDGAYLTYSPFPHTFGTDRFVYTVTDGTNSDSAWVTVNVRSRPVVEIYPPEQRQRFGLGSNVGVTVTNRSLDWTRPVTNTVMFTNGIEYARSTNATGFSTNWSQTTPGFYTFVARATDSAGITNYSEPVTIVVTNGTASPHGPVAAITNLAGITNELNGVESIVHPVIREGLFDLQGSALDLDGDPVAYQILLLRPEDEDPDVPMEYWPALANLTPAPLNAQGFHPDAVTNSLLGRLDLTSIPNGTYDLLLRVRGGSDETHLMVRFLLDSNLKIGQFSFSEQDLVIPVSGIPLTVTRTYNSLNPHSVDFGYSWTMSLNDMDVQLDEERRDLVIGSPEAPFADEDQDSYGLPKVVSIRTGGGRDVTVTLPDGRRTTFQFKPRFRSADCQADARWEAPLGVTEKLEPLDSGIINLIPSFPPFWQEGGYNSTFENHDVEGWVLRTLDGTEFYLTRGEGNGVVWDDSGDSSGHFIPVKAYDPEPKLTEIRQRSGDSIQIQPDGIFHYAGSNGVPSNRLTRSVLFERDSEGRIAAVRDPNSGSNGLPVLRYIYNRETGNLIQVHRLVNRTTGACLTNRYHYDHPKFLHYLTSIEDARGIPVARNLYSDDGRLIGIIDVAGRTNSFEHNISNRVEIVRDRSGVPTSYYYDPKGNVTDIANVYGHTNHMEYRDDGALVAHTDPVGRTTTYSNDEQGNVLAVTAPHPTGANPNLYTTRYTYSTDGNQTSVILPTGAVITNLFDSAGRLQEVRDGTNLISRTEFDSVTGHEIAEIDRFGTNRFAFDSMGNCVRMTNSLGGVVYSGFDPNGNLTALTNDNQASSFQYDAQNRETTSDFGQGITLTNTYGTYSDWTSVDAPTIGHMERHFDDQGRLGGWTTANNATPGFSYEANGRLEFETNSIGVVTHTSYDLIGRAIAVTNLATGAGTTFDFDPANQRVGTTNALGGWTRFGYHLDGSLAASTNSRGYYWIYTNSTAGSCCGASTSGTVTDPLGRQVLSLLSASGLPMETIRQATNGVSRTNKTSYLAGMVSPDQEAEEYPETITDEGGRTRRFAYTQFGQLEQATDLSGNIWWTNQYDPESGALLFVISPTRETNACFCDELDNVQAIRFPDGGSLTNYYNAENRLSGVRLASGVTVSNLYDFAGRVTNRTARANGVVVESATFAYNLNDAVTIITDNTGGTTNLFDAAGRLNGIDYPSGASVRYQRDLLDRITNAIAKASPSGTNYSTRYQFDSVGNLTNVIDPFNRQIGFEFDAVNRKRKRTLPNGVVTTYDYNDFDQLTKIEHKKDAAVLARFEYERNPGGEPWKITREDGSWVELKYDAALRLTNEVYKTSGGGLIEEISYGYDVSGSRVRLVKGGTTLTNSVLGGYRIATIKNAANGNTVESYAFDTGGRVTTITRDSATLNLGYNSADQVKAVTNATSSTWVTYRHDATGRRMASTNDAGTVRKFVVAPTPGTDLESPLLVANASGTMQQGYVYIGYQPLMRYETNGTPVYYLEDAMGSIAALADANGNKSASFNYDGFGNVRSQSGSTATPAGTGGDFRFHGAWLEEGSSLYNMRAREYDARAGRFTSRDPRNGVFQRAETLNPYVYSVNNPCVFTDPSGEFTLVDLTAARVIDMSLETLKNVVIHKAKQYLKDQIFQAASRVVLNQLGDIYPPLGKVWESLNNSKWAQAGRNFEAAFKGYICDSIGADGPLVRLLWFYPGINQDGNAEFEGFNCPRLSMPQYEKGLSYPDFVVSEVSPKTISKEGGDKSVVIGDFKLSGNSLYNQYVNKSSISYKGLGQFDAITKYASGHTYSRTAVFLTVFTGQKPQLLQVRALLTGEGLRNGAAVVVLAAFKNKGFTDLNE